MVFFFGLFFLLLSVGGDGCGSCVCLWSVVFFELQGARFLLNFFNGDGTDVVGRADLGTPVLRRCRFSVFGATSTFSRVSTNGSVTHGTFI